MTSQENLTSITLSGYFAEKAEHQRRVLGVGLPRIKFDSAVIVGGIIEAWKGVGRNGISRIDEVCLLELNHRLIQKGICLDSNLTVYVCDLDHGSDFLNDDIKSKLLLMNSPYYSPDEVDHSQVNHSQGLRRQSPLAANPKSWDAALKKSCAQAIFSTYYSPDMRSQKGISGLIEATGLYKLQEVADNARSFLPPLRGADLYFHSDFE